MSMRCSLHKAEQEKNSREKNSAKMLSYGTLCPEFILADSAAAATSAAHYGPSRKQSRQAGGLGTAAAQGGRENSPKSINAMIIVFC